eukprot:Blabericola_migrator_1__1476@NODE_1390_length_4637_cov_95_265427_g930_i0_p1_GENE_NODE_1390_length_4637_cov_95_265427_g930_i0NODE_1390_length_4637_cov_95_265427_g930_i0_p1_ORF_typecomplete_len770_score146_77DEAD/PF00270_29/4_6e48DEAD/PF00270_29/61Helicase_C/PF00271_31/6e03Helicase_C/PF00271_31/2_3e25ResIII/PF04851_15/1_5e13ResIII/PF04851_15/4e03ERCC3_RAD25_C/PF16203_5/7_7e07DBP10CT/PF08147_12/7e06Flavi_DEAD/PF07652_14/0_00029Flavi_DEAD/PF07652_14/5_5e02AAA_19/PF13245_6/0_26AAA_19/PF13245_6/3_2e02
MSDSDERLLGTNAKKQRQGPFERLGLSPRTCTAVKKFGFSAPTPVQRKVIPAVLARQADVIAMARTGSGKTAAYLLPALDILDKHSQVVGIRGLIVVPTRELALQIHGVAKQLMYGTDLQLCLLLGGKPMTEQFSELANNPDIVIATPGRLVHHMVEAGLSLSRVQLAIFDEADQLWELNHEDDIKRILKSCTLATKQCLLLSATLPQRLADFASAAFTNPELIQMDPEKELNAHLELDFYYCRSNDKLAALLFWLTYMKEATARVIIFVATRHHAHFLAEMLRSQQLNCAVVAGTMTVAQRIESMTEFANADGTCKILLATDVAARGLDIQDLEYVFHYDYPPSSKLFIHRSGRTARQGKRGTAVSLVTKEDMPFVVELLTFTGNKFKASEQLGGIELGGFPNLDQERLIVTEELEKNSELERLHRSLKSSHKEYLRYRQPASKVSIQRASELLESLGGPVVLADKVHSKIARKQRLHKKPAVEKAAGDFLTALLESKEVSTVTSSKVEPVSRVDQETIRQFRPTQHDTSVRGMGVSHNVTSQVSSILNARKTLSTLVRSSLHDGGGTIEKALKRVLGDTTSEPPNKKKKADVKRGQADEERQFVLADPNTPQAFQEDIKMTAKLQLSANVLEIDGEDSSELRKQHHFMRWNPIKKRYEVTQVDKEGKRVKKKDQSGNLVRGDYEKTGLYKKWLKTSEQRVQKPGETEDNTLRKRKVNESAMDDEPVEATPLEMVTKDLGKTTLSRHSIYNGYYRSIREGEDWWQANP